MGTQHKPDPIKLELDQYTVAELREIGKRRGVKLPTSPKQAVVDTLAADLNNSTANRAVIERLSLELRQALDLLAWYDKIEQSSSARLLTAWGLTRTPSELWRQMEQLRGYGLAFGRYSVTISISPAVINLAPATLPPPVPPQTPPARSDQLAPLTLDALVIILTAYAMTHPTRLAIASQWRDASLAHGKEFALARVSPDLPAELLSAYDEIPPAIWELALALMENLRLTTTSAYTTVDKERLLEFASQAPAARLRRLYAAWLSLASWSEWRLLSQQQAVDVVYRPAFGRQADPAVLDSGCRPARGHLLRLLKRLTPGQWYRSQDVTQAEYQLNPGLLPNYTEAQVWGFTWPGKFKLLRYHHEEEWLAALGAFVEQWLRGPLTWLGGLAWRDDCFSLTPLGAWLLGGEAVEPGALLAQPSSSPALRVSPDGAITVDADQTDQAVWNALFQLASLEPARQRPEPSRLSFYVRPALLASSLDAGYAPDDLLAPLQVAIEESAAAKRPLQMIQQWLRFYGRIRIFTDVARLDLADDFALREIQAGGVAAPLRPLTAQLAVVPDDAFYAVRDSLVMQGHTPTVVDQLPGGQMLPGDKAEDRPT